MRTTWDHKGILEVYMALKNRMCFEHCRARIGDDGVDLFEPLIRYGTHLLDGPVGSPLRRRRRTADEAVIDEKRVLRYAGDQINDMTF